MSASPVVLVGGLVFDHVGICRCLDEDWSFQIQRWPQAGRTAGTLDIPVPSGHQGQGPWDETSKTKLSDVRSYAIAQGKKRGASLEVSHTIKTSSCGKRIPVSR